MILWQAAEEAGAAAPYWESHGLSIQRYYGITCLIYGSDRQRFASLPALAQMPVQQSANCEAEYARASESLDWLVAFASDARRGSRKPSMSVEYEPVKTRTSEHLVAELRSRELIEWTVARFGELVALSDDAKVVLRSCSIPEAAWVAESRELVICYELLDLYYLLSAEQHREGSGFDRQLTLRRRRGRECALSSRVRRAERSTSHRFESRAAAAASAPCRAQASCGSLMLGAERSENSSSAGVNADRAEPVLHAGRRSGADRESQVR